MTVETSEGKNIFCIFATLLSFKITAFYHSLDQRINWFCFTQQYSAGLFQIPLLILYVIWLSTEA